MAKRQLSAGDRCLWIPRKIHRSRRCFCSLSYLSRSGESQRNTRAVESKTERGTRTREIHSKYLRGETIFFQGSRENNNSFHKETNARKEVFSLSLVVAALRLKPHLVEAGESARKSLMGAASWGAKTAIWLLG